VIASADGSTHGVGEQVRLKHDQCLLRLNYDTNAALAQISSKIDQVRNQLPPDAELPTITVASSDNPVRLDVHEFLLDSLEQNQITDYLARVVHPQLSSIKGVQRADILGGRVFAMRVWLKPDELAARGLSLRTYVLPYNLTMRWLRSARRKAR